MRRGARTVSRPRRGPRAALDTKKDKLNWNLFGFLENLLIFCATTTRSVPEESGVHFQISPSIKTDGICLLFKIDRAGDPLMGRESIKPDYMALHITASSCICTIIEMKGREEKATEHGIDQIKALRDQLHREFARHLPGAFCSHVKYQGILLTPYNASVPNKRILQEARAGLPIVQLQYNNKAELYPYVRTVNQLSSRYRHAPLRRTTEGEFNFIEHILVHGAMPSRVEDGLHAKHDWKTTERTGIYISYKSSDDGLRRDDSYAALLVNRKNARVFFSKDGESLMHSVRTSLSKLGLKHRLLDFDLIPEPPDQPS